jgi:type III pantothenate kinase
MLAVIDIGNSNIVFGIYREGMLIHRFRVSTNHKGTSDEYGSLISNMIERRGVMLRDVHAVCMASVVPQLDGIFDEVCTRYLQVPALMVGRDLPISMPMRVDRPQEVGADRIVNAYAAWKKYKSAMVLVDLGTATTFDVVSNEGEYLGGAIAPGIEISSDALFRSASKLQRVELVEPKSAIGKNTKDAIQSGVVLGYVGLIDTLVLRMKKELGYPAKVLATGGLARFFQHSSSTIEEVDPDLTLAGLYLIYQESREIVGSS